LVRCLDDRDHVVLAQSPEDLLDCHPDLLGEVAEGLRPLRGVLDGTNPLVGEVPEHNVDGHVNPPFRATFPTQRELELFHPAWPNDLAQPPGPRAGNFYSGTP